MSNDYSKQMVSEYYRHYTKSLGGVIPPHKKGARTFASIAITAMENGMDAKKLTKFSAIEYYNAYIRPENFSLPRIKVKPRNIKNQTMKIRTFIDSESSEEEFTLADAREPNVSPAKRRLDYGNRLLISETKCESAATQKLRLPKLFVGKSKGSKDKAVPKPKSNYSRKNYRGLGRCSSRSSVMSHSSCRRLCDE